MTTIEALLMTSLPVFKMILYVAIALETKITSQNLGNFHGKYMWVSFIIVKEMFLQFTVFLLMILKLTIYEI